jgi:crotonobetainyl-CoA:carnitine CoA-transferase CaiB-like acyl-CoA transferase
VPSHCFRCADGRYLHVTAASDGEFARLCEAMQRPDLLEDPRFGDQEARKRNDVAIETIVADWLGSLASEEAERRLLAVKLPTGRVADIADVADNEQLRHRGHIVDVEHPLQGRIPVAGPPVRFSDAPQAEGYRIPLVGEHTDDVLREWLGYSSERLAELAAAGVTAPARQGGSDAK